MGCAACERRHPVPDVQELHRDAQALQGRRGPRGARDRRASGRAKYKPYVNTGLYNANTKSDRDKDGIACEQ